jgi:DNA-binding response OmpR family regulator
MSGTIDGIGLIAAVRANHPTNKMKVALMTSQAETDLRGRLLQLRALYVNKSSLSEELVRETLTKLLAPGSPW